MTLAAPRSTEVARLEIDGTTYELPIIEGSEGERAIDISSLRASSGLITLDLGYGNTGSALSEITFIDGEAGILRYRGYPIEELAERGSFLETSHLVLYGELPTQSELDEFSHKITNHTLLHEKIGRMYEAFPLDAHPMAVTSAVVGALSTFYPDSLDPLDPEQAEISTQRLLAKLPTICAYAFKYAMGQPFVYPRNDLSYAANMLYMMFSVPTEEYEINEVFVRAVETLLILHADHEQNCSTSTMRLVGSSRANIYASASAAIMALWGPLHGGANQEVIEMLRDIADNEGSARVFLDKAKDSNDTTRLMGFGHRVYKNFDPRATILKEHAHEVLDQLGYSPRLLEIARELEEVALNDDYFVQRKLYPNVDFYSGIIYEALGVPSNGFTPFFALGRMPGWIAHWREHHADPKAKIGRPRQIYVGETERHYVPIEKRTAGAA
ncbi:MAG: citrate synthase [Chloroflexi bacterium]|nr:citrate synthase [Chloroflexota bacterium]